MDVLHDSSHRTWYQLGTQFEKLVPAYVLETEMPTKEAAAELPQRQFADDVRGLFPIDTPASTWLSAAYFAKNANACGYKSAYAQYVERRITQAAETYGIDNDVTAIMAAIRQPPTVKQASDSDYGWVTPTERRYPMFDSEGVTKAAAYFAENRQRYPAEMRKTIASAILQKAAEYGADVPAVVRREAGHGMPRRDTLMAELLARAQMAKDAEVSQAVASVNEMIMVAGMDELSTVLDKVAEVVDALDRAEGLDTQYGKRIMAPADFIYDLDVKEAEALVEDCVELDKYVFSLQKLAELPMTVFSDVLGEDFVSRVKTAEGKMDVSKLGDELYSLPQPDKAALETHLHQACT